MLCCLTTGITGALSSSEKAGEKCDGFEISFSQKVEFLQIQCHQKVGGNPLTTYDFTEF